VSAPGAVAEREHEAGTPDSAGDGRGERSDEREYAAEEAGDQHAEDAHERGDGRTRNGDEQSTTGGGTRRRNNHPSTVRVQVWQDFRPRRRTPGEGDPGRAS
jgi:hypothetical protein